MKLLIILCFVSVAYAMLEIKGFPGTSSVQDTIALISDGITSFSTPSKQPTVNFGYKILFSGGMPLTIANLDKAKIEDNPLDEVYERIGSNPNASTPSSMKDGATIYSLGKTFRLSKLLNSRRCDAYDQGSKNPVYIYDNGEHYFKKNGLCSSLDSVSAYASSNAVNPCLLEPFKNAIMCGAFLTGKMVGFSEGTSISNIGEASFILVKQGDTSYKNVLYKISAIANAYGDRFSIYSNLWFIRNIVTTKGPNGIEDIRYGLAYPGADKTFTTSPEPTRTITIVDEHTSSVLRTGTTTSTSASTTTTGSSVTASQTLSPMLNPVEMFVASKAPNAKLDDRLKDLFDCAASKSPSHRYVSSELKDTDRIPTTATRYSYKDCGNKRYAMLFEVPTGSSRPAAGTITIPTQPRPTV
ncbi:hypothetical protein E6Q11_04725 [Candidatus Dojkabacteria bacterium]|uniref:Uncharacterized protein n=1 Tax=Candidatus Dojkabacteria bacterium TaxID=2099670 RepID=A0A5C7J4G1_9BACT|nr:MAG: hypothetical protein E6Q11_04725 [Candidatus Dojkabacteria bacterium]